MRALRDLFAFIGRIGIGIVLIAHGAQKVFTVGMPAVTAGFAQMGIPLAPVAAWFAAIVELVGGVLLIAGLLLPLVGICIAVDMAGALVLVHLPNGLFMPNGYELVLVIGAAALALGFNGGRWSLDHATFGRITGRHRSGRVPDDAAHRE